MDLTLKYNACNHFNKKQPKVHVDEDLKDSLSRNYRVMPLYEKVLSDHEFMKTHSLHRNKFLHCRWLEYQRIQIKGKPDPFQFPHVNDFHFKNYNVVYNSDLSINPEDDHRLTLRPGPGVDNYGDIPIPIDCFRLRGVNKEKNARKTIIQKELLKRKR